MTRQEEIHSLGLKSSTVYNRMRLKGLSYEEALLHDRRTGLQRAADQEGMTEIEYVRKLLPKFHNKKAPLARHLGISRAYLYEVLNRG